MAICAVCFLLVLALTGVSSEVVSIPFRGNSYSYIKIHWILQRMDGSMRNVSVRHSSFRSADRQAMWRVNDVLISESSPGFVVANSQFLHGNGDDEERLSVTSILIPSSVPVTKLELSLILDVREDVLLINLPDLDQDTTRVEYVPTFHMGLDNAEHIQYDTGRPMNILASFFSEMLNESVWKEFSAEYTGIDNCMIPSGVDVRKPQKNPNFITLTTPSESQVDWNLRSKLNDANYKLRYINFPATNPAFWGLLKVTAGFVTRDACNFFGGIKVTRTAFLRPPTHGDFFTENSTVFLKPKYKFYVSKGQDIDVTMVAIGGSEKEWTSNPIKEYPRVSLFKNRRRVTGSERIDVTRLFQREVIFRFRNVTERASGSYLVKARMGRGRARHSFDIIVNDVCVF